MGMTVCFGTHSGGSVLFPKSMENIVMPACPTGRSACGGWDDGKGPVWNVPGIENPACPMGRFLCCILQKSLREREHPSSRRSLSHLSPGRCWCWMHWWACQMRFFGFGWRCIDMVS